MDFINDINFVATIDRSIHSLFTNRTRVVNSTLTGSVNLNDINIIASGNRETGTALATRFAIFWTQAVECLGENSRSRGLAHATRANKQICMRGTLHTNSVFQSLNDMILSNDIGKTLWPPFSCDYLIFTHITLQKKLNFDPAKCVSQRVHVPIWTSAAIAIFIAIDARFMVRAINN